MELKNNISKRTVTMTTKAILTALLIVMSFTPLGYLKMPFLEISFLTIPVAIGAITLGPVVGAWLGFIFGLTSFIHCFMGSATGVILLGVSVVRTFIVCVVPRVLVGFLCGLAFLGLKKVLGDGNILAYCISSICAAVFNTIFFLSTMALLFYSTLSTMSEGKGVFNLLISWAGINAVIEAIACGVIATAIGKAIYIAFKKLNVKA